LKHTFSSIPYLRQLRFSCCWKDVRLKLQNTARCLEWQTVSVVVERMYDWSLLVSNNGVCHFVVSVVVERMYDWSRTNRCFELTKHVSVVVERMYDWSWIPSSSIPLAVLSFSCCWKDVRLKHLRRSATYRLSSFQLLLKGCTIEAAAPSHISLTNKVSVVVERMYDWSSTATKRHPYKVSVVVERMYDWSDIMCGRVIAYVTFQLLLKGCTIEACDVTDHDIITL